MPRSYGRFLIRSRHGTTYQFRLSIPPSGACISAGAESFAGACAPLIDETPRGRRSPCAHGVNVFQGTSGERIGKEEDLGPVVDGR